MADRFTENVFEQVFHTACGLNRRDHQFIRIDLGKINIVSGVANELSEERPLRSAIPLAEWLKHIENAIEIYNVFHELVKWHVSKELFCP